MKKITTILLLMISAMIFAQDKNWKASTGASFFFEGGFAANYEWTLFAQSTYTFNLEKRVQYGTGLTYVRSLDATGALLNGLAGIGVITYDFSGKINRGLYIEAQAGPFFFNERFSNRFASGTINDSRNSFGIIGSVHLGFAFAKSWTVYGGGTQFHTNDTALSGGIGFRF